MHCVDRVLYKYFKAIKHINNFYAYYIHLKFKKNTNADS